MIPNAIQGEDILVNFTIRSKCADIIIYGLNSETEFTEEFTEEFGSDLATITNVSAVSLINNIKQDSTPDVDFTQDNISLHFKSEDTNNFEKGLLETELLIEYSKDEQALKSIKRMAIAWIKNVQIAIN